MADPNRAMTEKAIQALKQRLEQDRKVNFPAALRRVGREVIQYTKDTHEYQNQTGELERSHDFIVIEPGKSETIEIITRGGTLPLTFSSSSDEIRLLLFTKQQYGLWVELKSGLNVLIQGFLKMRREFRQMFGAALKSGRVQWKFEFSFLTLDYSDACRIFFK